MDDRPRSMLGALRIPNRRIREPPLRVPPSGRPGPPAKQHRNHLKVTCGTKAVFTWPVNGFQVIVHADQYEALNRHDKTKLVESDKSLVIVLATSENSRNFAGRALRRSGVEPSYTLADTLEVASVSPEIQGLIYDRLAGGGRHAVRQTSFKAYEVGSYKACERGSYAGGERRYRARSEKEDLRP